MLKGLIIYIQKHVELTFPFLRTWICLKRKQYQRVQSDYSARWNKCTSTDNWNKASSKKQNKTTNKTPKTLFFLNIVSGPKVDHHFLWGEGLEGPLTQTSKKCCFHAMPLRMLGEKGFGGVKCLPYTLSLSYIKCATHRFCWFRWGRRGWCTKRCGWWWRWCTWPKTLHMQKNAQNLSVLQAWVTERQLFWWSQNGENLSVSDIFIGFVKQKVHNHVLQSYKMQLFTEG